MKKLKSLSSFEETGFAIKSRKAQKAITGGGTYTLIISDCGSENEDYDRDEQECDPSVTAIIG